ncbi:hypothetical protein LOK49_LG03G02583 [Camellia lanceoleosa]|uniref:Uncharacterized protein n=1 Tax=Camellia lanceoleosa TaxID=1840588 RepID=A0ACC0I9P3_9ERIC|nr:hypothetical protein LOK49_LG03G02583 [Camellia lanceoleosa]
MGREKLVCLDLAFGPQSPRQMRLSQAVDSNLGPRGTRNFVFYFRVFGTVINPFFIPLVSSFKGLGLKRSERHASSAFRIISSSQMKE